MSTGRLPATAVYFLNGLTLSTYLVRLPSLKDAYDLSDGGLGTIEVLFAVAALVAMQFTGALSARFGVRAVLRVSLAVMPVLLALIGSAGGAAGFAAVTMLLGAVHGTTDAAMNAYAVTVERRLGRPILNGCHAAWSVSVVVASLTTAALAHAGVPSAVHLAGAAVVLLAGGLGLGSLLTPAETEERRDGARRGLRGGWSRAIVALGLTGTVLMVCDGAALGWGAIYLHDAKGASLGTAAVAVTAYTAGQTGGRLVGDRLTMRYGAPLVFRVGGCVAVCGLVAAVVAGPPAAVVAGFAVMGLGASVLIPLAFSAAGRVRQEGYDAAALMSRFTTFTYAGILLGPAAIGWSAELVGLTWTLAALIPVLAAVAVTGGAVRRA